MCLSASDFPELSNGYKPIDISSEQVRIYTYDDCTSFEIEQPAVLFITESGSHRVIDKDGMVHRPTPGYVGISWRVCEGCPYFVA